MWRKPKRDQQQSELRFEAYGVGVGLSCDPPSLIDEVHSILPADRRECSADAVQAHFKLVRGPDLRYDVMAGAATVVQGVEPKIAISLLDARIRASISSLTSDWVFIHAGVVEYDGRTIVIPGRSFAGKTTLVRALIEKGARYFSDEYAVLDSDGWVHPYPRALSVRNGSSAAHTTDIPARELGAVVGDGRVRVGVVVLTSYKAGASWDPREGSTADAALALVENAVLAREQPQRVMSAISKAVSNAQLLEGERGEAGETAAILLGAVGG